MLALHFIAFWLTGIFIVMYGSGSIVLRLLAHRGVHFPDYKVDAFLFPITRAVQAIYLYFAFRTFYRDSVIAALLKSTLVAYLAVYLVQLYRFVLFFTALYAA